MNGATIPRLGLGAAVGGRCRCGGAVGRSRPARTGASSAAPARCRYERLRCSYEPARSPARSAFTARRERAEQTRQQSRAERTGKRPPPGLKRASASGPEWDGKREERASEHESDREGRVEEAVSDRERPRRETSYLHRYTHPFVETSRRKVNKAKEPSAFRSESEAGRSRTATSGESLGARKRESFLFGRKAILNGRGRRDRSRAKICTFLRLSACVRERRPASVHPSGAE